MTPTAQFLQTTPKPQTTTKQPTPPVVGKAPRFKINSLFSKPDITEAVLIYGPQGSGKTYTLVEMLRAGERILLMSTDLGGSGASTIQNVLRTENNELLENIREVVLVTHEEVEAFLAEVPAEIWEFNPTVIVWDGFSNYQTNMVLDAVGDMKDHKNTVTDARDEGAAFDQQDWGIVKRLSARSIQAFLALHNPVTRQFPVRVVTCWQEVNTKTLNGITTVTPVKRPMLVGQLKYGLGAGFGLVVLTKLTRDEKGNKKYSYIVEGHDTGFDKIRVKNLKTEEESFQTIWKEIVSNRK
jgi:hypothetical protein